MMRRSEFGVGAVVALMLAACLGGALSARAGVVEDLYGMVLIPGGTNEGSDPDYTYSLTVEPFFMDRTPVTKAQWDEVRTWANTNGYDLAVGAGKGDDHPVVSVNWFDVVKWCNARSEMEGRTPVYSVVGDSPQEVYRTGEPTHTDVEQNTAANGYRLPTVIEHQYASRGGLVGKRFPWGDIISHSHANYRANSDSEYCDSSPAGYHPEWNTGGMPYTSPVGSFAANGYGLYDMAGNVWNWCWDLHRSGSTRRVRGGSWVSNAITLRCGGVPSRDPDNAGSSGGFRAVRREVP